MQIDAAFRVAFTSEPDIAHQGVHHARQSAKPRAAEFMLHIAAQQGANNGDNDQLAAAESLLHDTAEIPPPQQVKEDVHHREVHQRVGKVAPDVKLQRGIVRPRQGNHHALIAHHVHNDEDDNAGRHQQQRKRPCAFADGGKEGKTTVVQPAAGVAGLPACRQIARIARVLKETRQFFIYARGLALVGQPNVGLVMLLNGQDNALRRHIIDKRLGDAWVGKGGNHQHGRRSLISTQKGTV